MNILQEKIEQYNENISKNSKQKKGKSFEIIEGKLPIILSAPHCVEQTRNGKIKQAEGETGAIVQIIAKEINCYAIYKTKNQNDDANYDIEENPYKKEIEKIINERDIKILIDIHGASNENNFDIEIGTDDGKNIMGKTYIIETLKNCLQEQGIENITENQKFKASSIHTISKYISQKTKIACIQLEITGKYRYKGNIEGIKKLIKGMEKFISEIKENF